MKISLHLELTGNLRNPHSLKTITDSDEKVSDPFQKNKYRGPNSTTEKDTWLKQFLTRSEVKVAQSSNFATPWTTVHGILRARILEWVAFPFSMGSSQPRDRTQISHIAGRFFTSWALLSRGNHQSKPLPSTC